MATIGTCVAEVMRETSGQCRALEVIQAIYDAVAVVDAKGNWEFQIAHEMIHTTPPKRDGTIDLPLGSSAAVGTGTNWSLLDMPYPELVVSGHRPIPGTITTPFGLQLRQGFLGPDLVNSPYALYQADYDLPADCEGGRDLVLRGPRSCGPKGDGEIPKKTRAYFERRLDYTNAIGTPVCYYTDGDNRGNNSAPRIRLYPYPTTAMELELTYYRTLKFDAAADVNTVIPMPDTFQGMIVMLATGIVMRRRKMPGWLQFTQDGLSQMSELWGRHAASPAYEEVAEYDDGAFSSGPAGVDGFAITRADY